MMHYTVVSPGRVNIIGEHVDHQNYPVFPCAIKQAITVDVEQYTRDQDSEKWSSIPALQIFHEDSEKFKSVVFQDVSDIKMVPNEHYWYNYVIASYFGICEYVHFGRSLKNGHSIDRFKGLPSDFLTPSDHNANSPCMKKWKLTVGGEGVPQAAGLSSSSALTCAGSIAWNVLPLLASDDLKILAEREGYGAGEGCKLALSRKEIADVSAHGEGYSGTASGGMDQAAICLSQVGRALLINFHPLTSEAVKLPKELALVVANTGRAAPKAVSYAKMYNKRVFELKCACYLILKKHGIRLPIQELLVNGLRDVLKMVGVEDEVKFVTEELPKCLKEDFYNKEEIAAEVDEETRTVLLEKRCGVEVWNQNDDFHCFERVRHVLTENARVLKCVNLCKLYGDAESTPESALVEIGHLLDGSFESLSGDFDCGCPELTELVRICKKAGAYGSRLTGAGWGGCTVSLVHKSKVDEFLKMVETEYFEPIITGKRTITPPLEYMVTDMADLKKVLFATEPSAPASVINFSS